MQLKMPQPMDPQLSSWPITGLVNRLSQFLGNGQLFGSTAVHSLLSVSYD